MRKLLNVLIFIAIAALAASAQLTVTSKKVTYTRPKPQSEFKRTFTIDYPKIKALTSALSTKIENAIAYTKAFSFTLKEEMNDLQWLEDANYEVIENSKDIFCIRLNIEGSAAYPSGSSKYIVLDPNAGIVATPSAVFTNEAGLAKMVNVELKKEIATASDEMKKDPETKDEDPAQLFADHNFEINDLDGFSVTAKGVTFHYDYGFPHVIQALQPDGVFFFTWAQINSYLKPGGLLARAAR